MSTAFVTFKHYVLLSNEQPKNRKGTFLLHLRYVLIGLRKSLSADEV